MQVEDVVNEVISDYEQAAGERGTWESHWDEVAQRVYPAYSGSFQSPDSQTPGSKRNQAVYDSTATIGLGRFAAVMESMLTPRNQTWHRLAPGARELERDRNVRLYLDEVVHTLFKYRYAPTANFAGQNHQIYRNLGAFGTGALFIDELADGPGLRYRSIHLGELYLYENHQGIIDKSVRRFPLTARQAVQQFGKDNLPEKIRTAAENSSQAGTKFTFLHCVKPRDEYDPNRRDAKNMKFASYYVCRDERMLVRESGYATFPYAIGRYTQTSGEVYGRSPAMEVLPAIKTINEQKKTMLKIGHRALDPVLLAHDDGVIDTVSLRNGAVNWGGVNAEGRELIKVLPTGNVMIGEEMMKLESGSINDAFLVTIFQILAETPEMTATEVLERVREKGILLAPTMGRQQSEYLGPMIDREIDVLSRQGLLPPMPPVLLEAGGEYRVEYESPLSRAQRAEEASGLMRTVEYAMKVAVETQNPEPLDHFDWDVILPEVSAIQAVPARWMRSLEQIKVIRANRAQQQQVATAIEAAPAAAGMMKAMQGQ